MSDGLLRIETPLSPSPILCRALDRRPSNARPLRWRVQRELGSAHRNGAPSPGPASGRRALPQRPSPKRRPGSMGCPVEGLTRPGQPGLTQRPSAPGCHAAEGLYTLLIPAPIWTLRACVRSAPACALRQASSLKAKSSPSVARSSSSSSSPDSNASPQIQKRKAHSPVTSSLTNHLWLFRCLLNIDAYVVSVLPNCPESASASTFGQGREPPLLRSQSSDAAPGCSARRF